VSRHEWEQGEIKLPSVEFAKMRQTLASTDLKRKEELFAASQEFWKSLTAKQKSDPIAYYQAFEAWDASHQKKVYRPYGGTYPESTLPAGLRGLVKAYGGYNPTTPKRVLKEDIDFPTNRTTQFVTDEYDASISFDKPTNTVHWHVSENNHAVEAAHRAAITGDFFAALDKVRWTRGTGGHFYGNDEYSSDRENGAGAGANYITNGYGPLGAIEAPYNTGGYRMADGTKVEPRDFPAQKKAAAEEARYRAREAAKAKAKRTRDIAKAQASRTSGTAGFVQGRVGAGSAQGGEFAAKQQSAPEVSL
jgi:hypothetical protein